MSEGRRRFRFSLKLLLVLMTLIAVYFIGHNNGYHRGRQDEVRAAKSANEALVFWLSGFENKPPK
jgi:hypothetical protein